MLDPAKSSRGNKSCSADNRPWREYSNCESKAVSGRIRPLTSPSGAAILQKLSSQQAGTLGELLTVAKLNTLGHAAYISPEGAPGHDVIVVVSHQPRSIEVKTRQFLRRPSEITRWPMDMQTKGDADFFIFIELDLKTVSPTFYLLTNAQARETYRNYKGGGNCYPADVRRLVCANDFSALQPQE